MANYSYAQLEGLWINAGGPRSQAPIAAAIAEAESAGNPNARNPSGASGLWQILGAPAGVSGNMFNPATNARMAVAKFKQAGNKFTPWVTFTNGAYRAFLSGKTTPNLNVPGSAGGGGTGSQPNAPIAAYSPDTCVWAFPGIAVPLFGNVGQFCIISKPQARALIGGTIIVGAGLLLGLPGAAMLVAGAAMGTLKAAGPMLRQTGAAVALIPGAEPVGMAIAGAGQAGTSSAQQTQRRRAARDAETERRLGSGPSEESDLPVRGGTIRESEAETRRRRAAARSRARRAANPGPPASEAEAGF